MVSETGVAESGYLPAGNFSAWLHQTRNAQLTKGTTNVKCDACVGCCTSSYFIHIGPDESQTLQFIPKQLLFPAPGLPKGHVLMGYDEKGHCPMLIDGTCSIYEHRPQTCRSYDCRVFPAAGIQAGDADKEPINQRISRWKFNYPTKRARAEHAAVHAAAQFLREHANCFPIGVLPGNPAQLAVLAIKVYEVFVDQKPASSDRARTNAEIADAVMAKLRQIDAGYIT